MRCISLFYLFVLPIMLDAQAFQYASVANGIQVYQSNAAFYGGGVSFYDFNKDGKDDLTFCIESDSIIFFKKVANGFQRIEIFSHESDPKHPTWVDYDNDGDADLFVTFNNSPCKLYRNDGWPTFTDVSEVLDLPVVNDNESFGASWADYNQDGWLDVYICNYNWLDGVSNWLCRSNGDGTFTEVAALLGVDNGSLASFQSTWFDYDMDGWLDLYVINDKGLGNALYRNTGFGTFSDVSTSSGAGVLMDSMSNSISDFDNDGDFDIYISNTNSGNVLLRNDDGVYTNVTEDAGVAVEMLCWGALWLDYNNNGYDDLHVATTDIANGNQNYFFSNSDGTLPFTDATGTAGLNGDDYDTYSSAKGDVNSDGYYDFIEMNVTPNTAALYVNSGFTNKWLKVGLQGTVSNRDAIGTLIEYWTNGQRRIVQTMCGENYLGQDSQYEILGLGASAQVDTLVLNWPNGWVDTYYNVAANQIKNYVEGQTFIVNITASENNICVAGAVTLSVGNYDLYNWSTGALTPTIEVTEAGEYSITVINDYGLTATADIQINIAPAPIVVTAFASPLCYGQATGSISITLDNSSVESIVWSNEANEPVLGGLLAGVYSYTLLDTNTCMVADTITLTEPLQLQAALTTTDVVCYGEANGSASLEISGGTGDYLIDWQLADSLALPAGNYEAIVWDENECELLVPFEILQPDSMVVSLVIDAPCFGETISAEVVITGGNGDYDVDWNGANPNLLMDGEYVLTVTDVAGCTVEEAIAIVENPQLFVDVNIINANDGNNGSALATATGGTPGYDYLWSTGSQTPAASALGQGSYTCIVTDEAGCIIEFEIYIMDTEVSEATDVVVSFFPNPFSDGFSVQLPPHMVGKRLTLENTMGEMVFDTLTESTHCYYQLAHLAAGVYVVRIGEWYQLVEKAGSK